MSNCNWVERRAEQQENLTASGVWLHVRAALEESIESFRTKYGNSYGEKGRRVVKAEPINDRRFMVIVTWGHNAGDTVSPNLEVKYTERDQEASIDAKWEGLLRDSSTSFRVTHREGRVVILHGTEECSADRVAEIILRKALFNEPPSKANT